jgi:NADH:ubiquinone oxidoreductase subunit E
MTAVGKRQVSLGVDEDLVGEIERRGGSLAATVNRLLRSDLERRRRQQALAEVLDRLAEEEGLLPPEDEAEVARYTELMASPLR